ncbi:MAG: HAMP domain-containing histidine kinase [Bacteroidetes bacterium]|nr:HAMP domain-containing histidine kinase [Bacteroidota bacterium]
MKLLNKTIRYYALISLPLLILAGLISYMLIKAELRDGTDESLEREFTKAKGLVHSNTIGQTYYLSPDSLSYIEPLTNQRFVPGYTDTLIYDKIEQEDVSFRKFVNQYSFNGKPYYITVLKTTIEEDELLEGILSTFFIVVGLLAVAFFVSNWLLSKSMWKPFYETLNELNRYEIKNHEEHNFPKSGTLEFNQLNETLNKLIGKIHQDYILQKEFTENASHELQTPIAVLKANVNLLMQSPYLKEQEMGQLQSMDNTLKKISSLNKALLLLAKIENNQFKEVEQINFSEVITKTIDNVEEVAQAKGLKITSVIEPNVNLKMNTTLCEVIVSNLLQNAMRHNKDKGEIQIKLSTAGLIVSNSGEPLSIKPEDLYVRFTKNDSSKESIGLGLAIVKGIADLYNFNIRYSFDSSMHHFELKFN